MVQIYTIFDIKKGDEMFSNSKIIYIKKINYLSKFLVGALLNQTKAY